MRRNIFYILFFVVSFALVNVGQVKASTVLKVSLEEVVANAELVFEGRVIAKESRLSPTTGNPFTYFTFEIIDVIEGSYSNSAIELGFMGGPKDGYVMAVTNMRMPELGERGVYFVESIDNEQVHPLYGWHQGHFLVKKDPSGGKEKAVPVLDNTWFVDTPTLKEFKQRVNDIRRKKQ